MYLLGAIEKLVQRMDSMERRLKRSEELIQHIVEGNAANRDGQCYDLYTIITSVCWELNIRLKPIIITKTTIM